MQTTICPLGPSSVSCIASINKFFRDEVLERLRDRRRSARVTTTEPEAPEAKKTTVTVTVDGVTFEAQPGELLIKAAQEQRRSTSRASAGTSA